MVALVWFRHVLDPCICSNGSQMAANDCVPYSTRQKCAQLASGLPNIICGQYSRSCLICMWRFNQGWCAEPSNQPVHYIGSHQVLQMLAAGRGAGTYRICFRSTDYCPFCCS